MAEIIQLNKFRKVSAPKLVNEFRARVMALNFVKQGGDTALLATSNDDRHHEETLCVSRDVLERGGCLSLQPHAWVIYSAENTGGPYKRITSIRLAPN